MEERVAPTCDNVTNWLQRMKPRIGIILLCLAACLSGQRKEFDRPARQAVRGTHAGVAAGSEFATEAGMRLSYEGGNAVDAGVAAMLAAATTEFSHFGFGGEAPILVR